MRILQKFLIVMSLTVQGAQAQSDIESSVKQKVIDLGGNPSGTMALEAALGKKRIVFIGERNHGDRETFLAKCKLIKRLVDGHNFQALVLEWPFYEMSKVNQFLEASKYDPNYILLEAFRQTDHYITGYRESLFPILIERRENLEIGGVEITSNSWYKSILAKDLAPFVSRGHADKYMNLVDELDFMAHCVIPEECSKARSEFDYAAFHDFSNEILKLLAEKSYLKKDNSVSFLMQAVKNNQGLARWVESLPVSKILADVRTEELNTIYALRDRQMADNLMWLLENKYRNKKVIVSTSTYHISRGLFSTPVMADYLPDSIVNSSYFLPFVSYEGAFGFETDTNQFPVTKFKRDSSSFEFLVHSMGMKSAFLNIESMNDQEKTFIDERRLFPNLENKSEAKWSKIYNGIYFISEMKPEILKTFSIKDDGYFKRKIYKVGR